MVEELNGDNDEEKFKDAVVEEQIMEVEFDQDRIATEQTRKMT